MNTTAPKFFGPNDGILPVWMTLGVGMRDLFIYSTHDGGATWNLSPTFIRGGNNTDFVTVNDGITWDWAGLFHVTNNAGASWSDVTPECKLWRQHAGSGFCLHLDRLGIQNQINGSTPLYRTSDGGSILDPALRQPDCHTCTQSAARSDHLQHAHRIAKYQLYRKTDNPARVTSLGDRMNCQAAGGQLSTGHGINGVQTKVVAWASVKLPPCSSLAYHNPVNAVVDATGAIAESDETNNSRSEMVAVPTAPLPCATPSFTPTPASLIGPYAVVRVALNDVLNIRSGAGNSYPVVGSFSPDTVNIMRTGPTAVADNATWAEVQNPSGGTGWVNAFYLTEYVSHDAFCADARADRADRTTQGQPKSIQW